jgi:hypothetical protein
MAPNNAMFTEELSWLGEADKPLVMAMRCAHGGVEAQ